MMTNNPIHDARQLLAAAGNPLGGFVLWVLTA